MSSALSPPGCNCFKRNKLERERERDNKVGDSVCVCVFGRALRQDIKD